MFIEPAVSMRELELESAELLPSRETLQVATIQWHFRGHHFRGHHFRHHRHHRHFPW